jgi:hypothetical protein
LLFKGEEFDPFVDDGPLPAQLILFGKHTGKARRSMGSDASSLTRHDRYRCSRQEREAVLPPPMILEASGFEETPNSGPGFHPAAVKAALRRNIQHFC